MKPQYRDRTSIAGNLRIVLRYGALLTKARRNRFSCSTFPFEP